ncbi:unnamed protein product [Calicophoron daubneyi]|uniref:UDP-D-xylose:beta-D-glucoside alpha-1,3-D-xylosyltransferase n=1 Tax=Calicophoron daubneyi TaxID=300641 RepID=A0AAV2TF82_CALDB
MSPQACLRPKERSFSSLQNVEKSESFWYTHLPCGFIDESKLIAHYYDLHQYEYLVNYEQYLSTYPRIILLKTAWPQILPKEVEKVICMDTDVLYNQNVRNLWSLFDDFDDKQMIAGAFELTENLRKHMATSEFPILETGINSGVLLLHLNRMRMVNWEAVSATVIKQLIKSKKKLKFPDQEVYNTFLYKNKQFFYQIPCHWNLVISAAHQVRNCSVAWIITDVAKTDCIPRPASTALAGLLHICTGKPENQLLKTFRNPDPVKVARNFSMKDLHNTFYEVYFSFRNLHLECFQNN